MIGDLAYPDLTTCGERFIQASTQQWDDVVASFDLNDWQMETLKGLFRMKRLSDDWDGEGSPCPSTLAVDSAARLIRSLPFDDMPTAFVSPTTVGGVQLEWSQNGRELEIEILSNGAMEHLTAINGNPQGEGPITNEQVPSLARWLQEEPLQNQTRGILDLVNSLNRT